LKRKTHFMLWKENLSFIKLFINQINTELGKIHSTQVLNKRQQLWLGFCLMGLLLSNSFCWAKYERFSLGTYCQSALSWMFHHSKINWDKLLICSVLTIFERYDIKSGVLVLDDSDHPRSKSAKLIYKLHKIKDKKTGGYVNGQNIVFLLLVSPKVTIPVGFAFYAPDPVLKLWEKKEQQLKKDGVKKKDRPEKPTRSKAYPNKEAIGIELVKSFRENFPQIKIKAVDADAFYGTKNFMQSVSNLCGKIQVISQLKKDQIIRKKNETTNLENYFRTAPFYKGEIELRGRLCKVEYSYIIAEVKAHDWEKRRIIALKYEGETEYRYLVALDLTWTVETVIQCYALRWLVEVFIEDWKSYEGWGQLTKHTGDEGSSRGLKLSLMLDHCLLFHPEQTTSIKNKMSAYTVGSLREKIVIENWINFIRTLLQSENPKQELEKMASIANELFKPNLSTKHLQKIEFNELEIAA